jgi:hypothetical protein
MTINQVSDIVRANVLRIRQTGQKLSVKEVRDEYGIRIDVQSPHKTFVILFSPLGKMCNTCLFVSRGQDQEFVKMREDDAEQVIADHINMLVSASNDYAPLT